MVAASATAALMTMAKRDGKRNRGGGCGGGSGGGKGGDSSGNFGGKPNFFAAAATIFAAIAWMPWLTYVFVGRWCEEVGRSILG